MDSPSFQNPRLSRADANVHRHLASDGDVFHATLLLTQTLPEDWSITPVQTDDELESSSTIIARKSIRTAWEAQVDPGPAPAEDADEDEADAFARRFALARFARRMVEGDPHAWIEALVSFWGRVPLPFDVPCSVAVEDGLSVRIGLEVPPVSAMERGFRMPKGEQHARYVEACCGTVITLAADAFRVLPEAADSVYVTAFREEIDAATGYPRIAILLRLATDRASLGALKLEAVTPSASFEYLGGVMRRERGELLPLSFAEPSERPV